MSGHAQNSCLLRKRAEEHVTTQLISSALVLWEVFIAQTRISKVPDGLKNTHHAAHAPAACYPAAAAQGGLPSGPLSRGLSGEERPPFKCQTDRTCVDFRDVI